MTDVLHVYTNLVCTSGFEYAFYQSDISQSFQDFVMGYGMFPLSWIAENSHLHPVFRVATYISGNSPFVFFYGSPNQCIVFAFGRFIEELLAQVCLGIRCLGYHEQT